MRGIQSSLRAFPASMPGRPDAARTEERSAARLRLAWLGWLVPVGVGLSTFAVFLGTLGYQFLDWDDLTHIAWNPHYRGLTWAHLSWMLTTGCPRSAPVSAIGASGSS